MYFRRHIILLSLKDIAEEEEDEQEKANLYVLVYCLAAFSLLLQQPQRITLCQ